jgi:hypothetical protein
MTIIVTFLHEMTIIVTHMDHPTAQKASCLQHCTAYLDNFCLFGGIYGGSFAKYT